MAPSRAYNVRRRDPRYVSSVAVTLQRFSRRGPSATRGVSLDISMHGMSALVCGALRKGETVLIGVRVQNAPVEILATVRHISDARTGFEFYPLSMLAQQRLRDWIWELEKHEETLFPYAYANVAKAFSN
jgi:c-di-GMP-binding flagellar brake protein YcgR